VKLQGTTFSCNSVATKVGTGLGGAAIGWALSAGGYVAGLEQRSESTVFMIKGVYLYLPAILCIVTLVCNRFMDIEHKIPAIREEISRRAAQDAGE